MSVKFRLEINLGSDAMITAHDVARALEEVADKLYTPSDALLDEYDSANIRDENGNTVGRWRVLKEDT